MTSNTGATLESWLAALEHRHPVEIELGLDRVLLVLRRLFPKPPSARIITVAGTNGKGSTIAALESILRDAGQTVAAYTSPHIERYNERIRIDGQELDDARIVRAFERVESARGSVSLTYFEFGTLAAFVAFEEAGSQNWLLEVGLGGRLDAVNALDPNMAVITSVGLDHTAWLGNDRETIGYEKAGVLRAGGVAICAELEPPRSVVNQARAQGVSLYRHGEAYRIERDGERLEVIDADGARRVALPDRGLPEQSLAAAVQATWLIEPEIRDDSISASLAQTVVPGRFEVRSGAPAVILDVGHNPDAARWLADRLHRMPCRGRRYAIYAGLEDKDSGGVMEALANAVDVWYLASLRGPRALPAAALEARGRGRVSAPMHCCDSVGDALSAAMKGASPGDEVIVFGSFYTVAEARAWLDRH
ncbi:dihydrofolate synthase/folylpolyglutamate synthase [Tamilnaduibacter salinus]|uniref:Dihydrofolate synthase/folylpolyglutamate synthase n=1 Tax=Tamilnaduibacter salinus TaxID=1484056 RepID=A0A2U1CZN3_9GAMM|nr:bifunctional tetrahydrofolate synthase/dihydrofolate synthase [Tamilnaduibacter salinus]PVY78237.1 dihydrofolate synthase/folylpolyglutamate synthase [Tamilnaduibacter salinus]